jgi:hypothetical protein
MLILVAIRFKKDPGGEPNDVTVLDSKFIITPAVAYIDGEWE